MLSSFLSSCLDGSMEPLRFRGRKASRPHVTASPVLVEFGKLGGGIAGQRRKRHATASATATLSSSPRLRATARFATCMKKARNQTPPIVTAPTPAQLVVNQPKTPKTFHEDALKMLTTASSILIESP
ncbi:hypothetical protein HPB51_007760 [Rhipicephalus microplus]|uniref:Uncharacterized protein n=1 Tax=Rhipicephalus microplus TaxID=6941 RepID=A0A9J6EMA6_RHIMP|nr:hypothetical protein HPB51_007760 [Rhipicephalus microplus]